MSENIYNSKMTNEEELHFNDRLSSIEKMTNTLYELLLEQNQMLSKITKILE